MPKTTTHNLPHSSIFLRTLGKEVFQPGNPALIFMARLGALRVIRLFPLQEWALQDSVTGR